MPRLSPLTLFLVLLAPLAAAQDVGGVVVEDPFADPSQIVLDPQPAPAPSPATPAPTARAPLPEPRPAGPEVLPPRELVPPLTVLRRAAPAAPLSPQETLGLIVREGVRQGLGRVLPDARLLDRRDDDLRVLRFREEDDWEDFLEDREDRREDALEARKERRKELRKAEKKRWKAVRKARKALRKRLKARRDDD